MNLVHENDVFVISRTVHNRNLLENPQDRTENFEKSGFIKFNVTIVKQSILAKPVDQS